MTDEAVRMLKRRLLGGFFYGVERVMNVLALILEAVNNCIRNWRGR